MDRVKLLRNIFFGALFCVFAGVGLGILAEIFEEGSSQAPIRSLRVQIDSGQIEELFNQLRRFAAKHDFSYTLTDYGGQGRYYLVDIRGDNIKILTNETSRNIDEFEVSFFALSPGDPLPDRQLVDDLLADLKDFLSEIPNARVTEEK